MNLLTLGKESIIYGLGSILIRLTTFALLPIYTNTFSPEEYGIISLGYVFLGFMTVVLHFGLDAALLKFYKSCEKSEQSIYVTNTYIFLLLINILLLAIQLIFYDSLSSVILGNQYSSIMILLSFILFFDVLWSVPMLMMRADNKPNKFVLFNLISVFVTLALNIVLIVNMKMGISAVFISNLISSALLFILTYQYLFKKFNIKHLDYSIIHKLINFGYPFILAGIFTMVIQFSDRYMIEYFLDLEQLGLYSASYKWGSVMLLCVMAFNSAWQPFFLNKDNQGKGNFENIAMYVCALFIMVWAFIITYVESSIVTLEWNGKFLLGQEYWNSIHIIKWVSLGYVFHGIYILLLPYIYIQSQTKWVAVIRGMGAITNVILNIFLIPHIGILGASLATCISFILMAMMVFSLNKNHFLIKYDMKKIISLIALIPLILIAINISDFSYYIPFSIPVFLYLIGFFDVVKINKLTNKIKLLLSNEGH